MALAASEAADGVVLDDTEVVDDVVLAAGLALVVLPQADATMATAMVASRTFHLKFIMVFLSSSKYL